MLSLHTNAASLSTQNSLASTNKALSSSMTKLGTGYRVNSAMDDAAGLQIATRLNAQARGMSVAQKNTQNGISMLQTAEGALSEVSNMVLRMKDLATESATASTSADDRAALQAEFDALATEIGSIVKNTSFGGAKLFSDGTKTDGTGGTLDSATLTFQTGSTGSDTVTADTKTDLGKLATALAAISSNYATPGTAGTEISSATSANALLTKLSTAIDSIGTYRSDLGAASNRLEHVYNNLGNMIQNTEAAKGRILDVDYASETANMTNKQMLMQASTSMLKQSSSMSQMVASLLQ
ncbi:flagellin [Comamonas sp. AG1104]|uniref:flagellin N-terminal helical domain-containing protein n=1 Tax=Comamonas sp. AG1104 TaxID=2183900 RepID=UPI000E0B8D88|nr:flagellin [Comamonas sp. AG1104]RDI05693.1 flagellin [Comamonas sp. AG1104]